MRARFIARHLPLVKYGSVGAALCGRPNFVADKVDCLLRDDLISNPEMSLKRNSIGKQYCICHWHPYLVSPWFDRLTSRRI